MAEVVDPETGEVKQLDRPALPAERQTTEVVEPVGDAGQFLMSGAVSPAIQIMLNDRLFDRCKIIAKYMAGAQGFTPRHLIGHLEACFAVVVRSLTWKLDPFTVACSTYQTPGGVVGYEGKLIIAIMENSGKIEGGIRFEHYGDWSKVQGKFEIRTSQKNSDIKYPAPTWSDKDAVGLGVIVRAQIKDEAEMREHRFDLIQAQPRNSTLWATDPKTQICYTAARRFASVACPGLIMGVPFDRDDQFDDMRDVTPARPKVTARVAKADPVTAISGNGAGSDAGSVVAAAEADGEQQLFGDE